MSLSNFLKYVFYLAFFLRKLYFQFALLKTKGFSVALKCQLYISLSFNEKKKKKFYPF